MKLSWRDAVTTLLAIAGGVIVYAGLQDYSWWLVGNWRGAVLALGAIGIAMCIAAGGDIENKSLLNRAEMWLGMICFPVIIAGLIVSSQFIGLALAVLLGALWLISTARHARHSLIDRHAAVGIHSHRHAHVH